MKVYIIRDECTGYYHLGGNVPAFNDVAPPMIYYTKARARIVRNKMREWSDKRGITAHDYQVIECEVTPLS